MGRAFARRYAGDLGIDEDPSVWSSDQVLIVLLLRGEDLFGNFVLGDAALERAQRLMLRQPDTIRAEDRADRYGNFAAAALAGRWADLLISEHLAAQRLLSAGVPAAQTEIVFSGARCCLEVARFDRIGAHGRVGFVSLRPLDAAHYGSRDRWVDAADRLERDRWLGVQDADYLRLLWWFGGLIANSDMHFTNTGLFLTSRPFSLVPSFDMLPMLYRPNTTGEIVAREFCPPLPTPAVVDHWRRAAAMAEDYWRTVEQTEQISRAFRDMAGGNAEVIRTLRGRF